MPVIALVFDYDDTLVPDTTSMLLEDRGLNVRKFWTEDVANLVREGYDPAVAWLQLLLEQIGPGKPLREITNADLTEFGSRLDGLFYQGLPEMFDDLREKAAQFRDLQVEFYIISGGLRELLTGSEIVRRHFSGVYASQLGEDEFGRLTRLKRVVTFTEKTRYLFEINKGLVPEQAEQNPYLVNREVPEPDRRIPFKNIFYVGDGLTDIPCFSLVRKSGGTAFGVFDPTREDSAKKAFIEMLKPARVITMNSPRYGPEDDLGALLRAGVTARATQIRLEGKQAEG